MGVMFQGDVKVSGAGKIPVDSSFSKESTNAIQNKVVSAGLEDMRDWVTGRHVTFNATVTTNWTQDGDYFYQDIAVSGILETDSPVVDIVTGSDNATNIQYSESICKVFRITTSENSIRVWATEAIAAEFPIQLKAVR